MKTIRDRDASRAQVSPGQALLFPRTAPEVCREIGVNLWAASKLHENGVLSFNPESASPLNEDEAEELRFIGSLIAHDCTPSMLTRLLSSLPQSYRYFGHRLYYNWALRCWRVLEEVDEPTAVREYISRLQEAGDNDELEAIKNEVETALAKIDRA